MKAENATMEQHAKSAVKSEKSQAWRRAMVAALGVTVGAGASAAVINWPLIKPDETEKAGEENKDAAANAAKPATSGHAAQAKHEHEDVSLPDYYVYDQEVVTAENGSQAEYAWGWTTTGHNCLIVDSDMDGKGNYFYEDKNGDGFVENTEVTDLAKADITLSMEHLPEMEVTVVVAEHEDNLEAIVVDADPAVSVDTDDQIDVEFQPDYNTTDTYDMASDGDIVADPNENFMA